MQAINIEQLHKDRGRRRTHTLALALASTAFAPRITIRVAEIQSQNAAHRGFTHAH